MQVTPLKTKKVLLGQHLFPLLDESIPKLSENSIVVVTSKVVSICQGRVVKNDGTTDKKKLIQQEADWYIDEDQHGYGIILTIKNDVLIASAGIDESNGDGNFVLWPEDIHAQAAAIWNHLRDTHSIKNLGVIITDSRVTPMRWGTIGVGLSWCGFEPLNNYIGTPDIFGHTLRVTKASILDGLAGAAVLTMGEGDEQTPLCLIKEVPFIKFVERPPSLDQIKALRISKEEDIFGPLTNTTKWVPGGVPLKVEP